MHYKNYKAFTLVEIILVLGIFAVAVALSGPTLIGALGEERIETVAVNIVSNIELQRSRAVAGKADSAYGVYLLSSEFYLYQGDSYDTAVNLELVEFEGNYIFANNSFTLDVNGGIDINFSKGSTKPLNTGSFYVNNSDETESITVNSYGLVDHVQ